MLAISVFIMQHNHSSSMSRDWGLMPAMCIPI